VRRRCGVAKLIRRNAASGILPSFAFDESRRCHVYLDSIGSLVLFLTCAVGPALIAYLVLDDLRRKAMQRFQPQQTTPVAPAPRAPERRFGWFAWSS